MYVWDRFKAECWIYYVHHKISSNTFLSLLVSIISAGFITTILILGSSLRTVNNMRHIYDPNRICGFDLWRRIKYCCATVRGKNEQTKYTPDCLTDGVILECWSKFSHFLINKDKNLWFLNIGFGNQWNWLEVVRIYIKDWKYQFINWYQDIRISRHPIWALREGYNLEKKNCM